MTPGFYAILVVRGSLAALILTGLGRIRADLDAARTERQAIHRILQALAERVARLEGAFPFLVPQAQKDTPGKATP